MQACGPVGAIGGCQQAAPAIAASLSEEGGAEVRRMLSCANGWNSWQPRP